MQTAPDLKQIPKSIEAAIIKAFQVQLQMPVRIKELSTSVDRIRTKRIDCLSTVVLDSDGYAGSLALGFPKETVLKIIHRMIGESYPSLTPENSDAAGELLNIIYASSRKSINESGFNFGLALPATVIGTDLALTKSNLTGSMLIFDCETEAGPFFLLLSMRVKK